MHRSRFDLFALVALLAACAPSETEWGSANAERDDAEPPPACGETACEPEPAEPLPGERLEALTELGGSYADRCAGLFDDSDGTYTTIDNIATEMSCAAWFEDRERRVITRIEIAFCRAPSSGEDGCDPEPATGAELVVTVGCNPAFVAAGTADDVEPAGERVVARLAEGDGGAHALSIEGHWAGRYVALRKGFDGDPLDGRFWSMRVWTAPAPPPAEDTIAPAACLPSSPAVVAGLPYTDPTGTFARRIPVWAPRDLSRPASADNPLVLGDVGIPSTRLDALPPILREALALGHRIEIVEAYDPDAPDEMWRTRYRIQRPDGPAVEVMGPTPFPILQRELDAEARRNALTLWWANVGVHTCEGLMVAGDVANAILFVAGVGHVTAGIKAVAPQLLRELLGRGGAHLTRATVGRAVHVTLETGEIVGELVLTDEQMAALDPFLAVGTMRPANVARISNGRIYRTMRAGPDGRPLREIGDNTIFARPGVDYRATDGMVCKVRKPNGRGAGLSAADDPNFPFVKPRRFGGRAPDDNVVFEVDEHELPGGIGWHRDPDRTTGHGVFEPSADRPVREDDYQGGLGDVPWRPANIEELYPPPRATE